MEAAETPSRMRDLLFSLKLLGLFILSLMVLCHTLIAPSNYALETILPTKDCCNTKSFDWEIGQTIFVFSSTEALYLLSLGVVTLFTVTVIIYAAMEHHSVDESSWKRIFGTWRKLLITWVYIILLAASYVLSLVLFIGHSAAIFKDILLRIVVLVLVLVSFLYLMVVWILESIISVFEGDCQESDGQMLNERLRALYMEEGVCNEDMKRDEDDSDEADESANKMTNFTVVKILLVLVVCGAASYVLIGFGINGEGDKIKGGIVMSIVATFLFLPTELLIFIVFVALFWCLHKVKEGKWSSKVGFRMVWLPLALILSLLAVDPKKGFAYLNIR